MGRKKFNEGFTLVEMIVVIAIIAILAAVIIPTTAGFIDRARLSNDRQNAARMTQVIQIFDIENDVVLDLDANDVWTILNDFSDEAFDFETTSRNTGYFYLSSTRRVVVARLDQASQPNLTVMPIFLHSPTVYADPPNANLQPGPSPEELFGTGRFLLSTSGSVAAEVIHKIRSLGDSEDFEADWVDLVQSINDLSTGFFGISEDLKNRLLSMVDVNNSDSFHHKHTLYVGNIRWNSGYPAASIAPVNKIIFTRGISVNGGAKM